MIDRGSVARVLKLDAPPVAPPSDEAPTGRVNDWPVPPRAKHAFRLAMALVALAGVALLGWSALALAGRVSYRPGTTADDPRGWLIAGAALLVIGGSALLMRPEAGSARRQIVAAVVWTITLLAALIGLWLLIDGAGAQTEWRGTALLRPADVDAFLADHPALPPIAAVPDGDAGVLRVPTGVMLQSAEFLGGSNVRVTGYVWQKYPSDLPDDVVRGFVLPDALTEAYRAEEAYRYDDGTTETIGWYIAATLREAFDYARYPFDRPNIWLRLWARDFDRNILLVPDFAAYPNLAPTSMPGVEGGFVYANWDPAYSGFSYHLATFNSDFGIPSDDVGEGDPELHFNLVLKRDPLGPASDFLSYTFTVALLTFGLLTLTSANPDIRGRFGISTAGVLGSVSVLLFGVISKQGGLRTSLDTQQLTYLEALPILLYGMLLLTATNAILVCAPFDFKVLEYRDNLLPEILFWPVLLGVLCAVTLAVFFV